MRKNKQRERTLKGAAAAARFRSMPIDKFSSRRMASCANVRANNGSIYKYTGIL